MRYNDIPGVTINMVCLGESCSKMYLTEPRYNDHRYNDIPHITMRIERTEREIFPDITCNNDHIRKWYCVLSSLLFNSFLSFSIFDFFYSNIMIFSVILWPYRYIGSFDITIPRYSNIILLLPWHIVISGFHCNMFIYIFLVDQRRVASPGSAPENIFVETRRNCGNPEGLAQWLLEGRDVLQQTKSSETTRKELGRNRWVQRTLNWYAPNNNILHYSYST